MARQVAPVPKQNQKKEKTLKSGYGRKMKQAAPTIGAKRMEKDTSLNGKAFSSDSIAAGDEASAQVGIPGKWDNIIFNYCPCGAFDNSFRYGFLIDILSDFIAHAEKFKATLSVLDASVINDAMGVMWDFIHGHKLRYLESIIYEETREEFKYLFDTTSAVLMLQFNQVVEKRAKELGVNIPVDKEYMVRERS